MLNIKPIFQDGNGHTNCHQIGGNMVKFFFYFELDFLFFDVNAVSV